MLWDPAQWPQLPVCLTPNPDKTPTHVGDLQPLQSHLACPSDSLGRLTNPGWTPIAHPGIVPLGHLGLTTPHQCPGHCPISASGSKPTSSPSYPNSVLHIVVVLHCCSLPDPINYSLHTLIMRTINGGPYILESQLRAIVGQGMQENKSRCVQGIINSGQKEQQCRLLLYGEPRLGYDGDRGWLSQMLYGNNAQALGGGS